jgi:hypothetical protein
MGDAMLQILLQPTHALVNICQGVCVGGALMPLAVGSEVDTWGDSDLGALEDAKGQGSESHMTLCPAGRLEIYGGTLE